MDEREELRKLIGQLVAKIEGTKALRMIYRFVNDLFCAGF